MMEYNEYVEILSREIDGRQEKLEEIAIAKSRFPDLKITKDRWGKLFLVSKQANAEVNQVSFAAGCGCCTDAPIFAYPHLKFGVVEVYSDPYRICIGEKNVYGYGIIEDESWEQEIIGSDIPTEIGVRIRAYLDASLPEEDEDEED